MRYADHVTAPHSVGTAVFTLISLPGNSMLRGDVVTGKTPVFRNRMRQTVVEHGGRQTRQSLMHVYLYHNQVIE
jgi:hypothetical protein